MVFIQRLLCRLQASVFPCPQLTGIDQDILFLLVFRNQRAAVMIPRQILKRVRIGGEMKLRMEYDVSAVVKNIPQMRVEINDPSFHVQNAPLFHCFIHRAAYKKAPAALDALHRGLG